MVPADFAEVGFRSCAPVVAGAVFVEVGVDLGFTGELLFEERHEVAGMETIADLIATPAKADVFKRAAAEVGVEPIGEDALVGTAELAGAGEDAATVDPNRKIEGLAVFEGEGFAREFRRTVEGNGRCGREFFRDAGGARARRKDPLAGARSYAEAKGAGLRLDGKGGEGRDRVDPAGAK